MSAVEILANVHIDSTRCMLPITMSDLKVIANVHIDSIYAVGPYVAHYNVNLSGGLMSLFDHLTVSSTTLGGVAV